MGKEWDKGVPSAEVYRELLRVLKPGAFGLHFGGTRTFHRLAVNLEDAGFEIKDCLSWLYGSGFPKSHNISKALDKAAGAERLVVGEQYVSAKGISAAEERSETAAGSFGKSGLVAITAPATPAAVQWDGYGTALKPAWEPCLLVQKPLASTYANNVLVHGCGALNIDGCRVGTETISVHNAPAGSFAGGEEGRGSDTTSYRQHEGRFPANLLLDEVAAEALDSKSGIRPGGNFPETRGKAVATSFAGGQRTPGGARAMKDTGGASRFFYTAKVSTKERNAGCEHLEPPRFETNTPYGQGPEARAESNAAGSKNNHPTLKPLSLTEYLAKLLLVPERTDGKPRRILVPFSGAGSEAIGAALAGWDEVVGIEIDPEYVKIAEARAKHWLKD